MRLLAIDYGKRKIGLAVSTADLAEPFEVIRFVLEEEALEKVSRVAKTLGVLKVVVGVSEGEMGKESRRFGRKLEKEIEVPVVFQDETLTTKDAQDLAIKAGIRRKKRKRLEDAYSAALILQSYIDGIKREEIGNL